MHLRECGYASFCVHTHTHTHPAEAAASDIVQEALTWEHSGNMYIRCTESSVKKKIIKLAESSTK